MSREKLGRCLALVYRPDRQKRSKVRYPVSVYKQFRILSSREKLVRYLAMVCMPTWLKRYKVRYPVSLN